MKLAPVLLLLAGAAQAAAGEPQPVLLDFNAEWCGPCRQMRPAVQALIDKGYPVRSVDIDRSPKLAEKYDVQAVPTFVVVDASGAELARSSGAQPAGKLARFYLQARDQAAARQADRGPDDDEPEAEAEAEADEYANDQVVEADPEPASADEGLTEREIAERKARNRDVNPKPWETAVRIRVHNGSSIGFGSGTIIHSTREESLILTCAHIFKTDNGRNYPPAKFPNKITVDLFDGKLKGSNKQMACIEEGIPGKAVDYDFATDVGLIVIRPGRQLPASRVVPPHFDPQKRMHMYTVGCSEGADASMWETVITRPPTRLLKGNDEHLAIECARAPKQGRSGGGLYTDNGFLAGVCNFAEPQGNRGLYAAPESIYRLLDRNKLAALYAPPSLDGSGTLLADNSRSGRSIRGQSPEPERQARPARGGGLSVPDPSIVGIRLEPLAPSDPRRPQVQAASSRTGGDRVAWAAPRSAEPAEGIPHVAAQPTDLELDGDVEDSAFPPPSYEDEDEGDEPTGPVNREDVAPVPRKPTGNAPGWRPAGSAR